MFGVNCGLLILSFCSTVAFGIEIPINMMNLEADKVRWAKVVDNLTSKGVTVFQRLSAIDGKSLSSAQLSKFVSRKAQRWCTPGMIGCYLSHVKFWSKVAREDYPYQLVLEDDAVPLCDDFYKQLHELVTELENSSPEIGNNRWDALLLGGFSCVHPQHRYGMYRVQAFLLGDGKAPHHVTRRIHRPHRPLGGYAYLLSKQGAQKLLNKASRATFHLDCVMYGVLDFVYICDPLLVFQDMEESPSTIGSVIKGLETRLPSWQLDDYTYVNTA